MNPEQGVVLVTGATGGLGRRVVQQLLTEGRNVRALVRDVDKAKKLLGQMKGPGYLDMVVADLSQKQTLLPGYFLGVRAVISCSAVIIRPKEADDQADREAKYQQGIKFFDPAVVGDTPEVVEYRGMQNLLAAVRDTVGLEQGTPILDPEVSASGERWGALDDVVMGGVSESQLVLTQGAGEAGRPAFVFRGLVTTANNGGFASVRTKNFEPALDLGAYEGLELKVKGNGLRYKCTVRTDPAWDGVGYNRSFDTVEGKWQVIRLPFKEFFPVFRARTVRDGSRVDPAHVVSIQLMLSKFEYDGDLNPHFQEGDFQLPIQSIKAYVAQPVAPRLIHVSSASVTKPTRPGINIEEQPPAVKLNDQLGGLLTYKLAGEDEVRASGVPYAVVRPTALTEEPGGMPVKVLQGDDVTGKVSRDDVARLCCSLLAADVATNTTFEVSSTVPFSEEFKGDTQQVERDWVGLLKEAGLQQGVTGKTINGVYTGDRPEAEVLGKEAVSA